MRQQHIANVLVSELYHIGNKVTVLLLVRLHSGFIFSLCLVRLLFHFHDNLLTNHSIEWNKGCIRIDLMWKI